MFPLVVCLLLCVLLGLSTCDAEDGGSDLEPSAFRAGTTGTRETRLEGTARYSQSSGAAGTRFMLRFRTGTTRLPGGSSFPDTLNQGGTTISTGIFLSLPQSRLPRGTYRLIDLPHPQYDTNTRILTETTRGVTLAMVYAITSGTLTIDSNEDGRLRGNFEQAAEGDPTLGNAGVIEVSGSFVAVEGF